MGNGTSKELKLKRLKFEEMFARNFQLVEERNDQMFEQISLFRNKNTGKVEVVLKAISYSD